MESGTTVDRLLRRSLRCLAAVGSVAAVLTSCDARTPTGSTSVMSGSGRVRFDVSAPTTVGQANVYNPGTNIAPVAWEPSNITLTGSDTAPRWVVLRVEGQITDVYNHEQCDTLANHAGASSILCSHSALENYGYGPLSNTGSAHVDVALQRGPYAPLASGAVPAPPLPLYPVVADSSVAEALWDVRGTVNVWTHRIVNVGGGGSTSGSTYEFPSYKLFGTQTLTVLEVAIPVKVSGPTAVTRGDSVTFTTEVTGNYRPRTESGLGQPGPFWYFHYNDTTATPNRSTFFEEMSSCRGKVLCRIRADHQGRMYVTEYLEGRQAENQSEPMKFQQAKLAVACRPDTLVVGITTACTASVTPAATAMTVQEWRFIGDSVNESSRRTGDVKAWAFRPKVSGTVTVTAMVGGQMQTASTRVEVVCNMLEHVSDDSLLNDVAVQRALRQYWNQSKPDTPDISARREQGGYIFQDTVTGAYRIVPMSSNLSPTLCGSTLNGNDVEPVFNSGQPLKLVATFHTHPHPQGTKPPTTCNAKNAHLPGAAFGDGASDFDYDAVNSESWNIPAYIVDRDHVHRINPGEHAGDPDQKDHRSKTCD